MSNKPVQRGNRKVKKPGTCNQKGNNAPKFRWPPAIRVLVACIAYYQDYTDDQMGRLRNFPKGKDTFELFKSTVPWFEKEYNDTQKRSAKRKGYPLDELQPFAYDDVHGRLHYLYCKPGSKKHSEHLRLYGISVEHHDSTEQHKPGGRAYVFAKCSVEIFRRLKFRKTISKAEITRWGQV
jgi:hypothetical protein